MGDLSACKSKRTLIRTINRQQAPFSGVVAGSKQSRSNLVLPFCEYFFSVSFASLNFDHPQKEKINLI
jgi:hypothetical protein